MCVHAKTEAVQEYFDRIDPNLVFAQWVGIFMIARFISIHEGTMDHLQAASWDMFQR